MNGNQKIVAGNPYEATLEALDNEQQRAPAAGSNIYDRTLAETDQGQRERLSTSITQAQEITPDLAAEARQISLGTGIPQSVVERNIDTMRRQRKIRNTPYDQIINETPKLAEFIENADNLKIVQDDLEPLGALEWLFTTPQRSFARGMHQIEVARLRNLSMQRPLTRSELDQLDAAKFHMTEGGELGAGNSWFRGAVSGAAAQLPILFGAALQGSKRAVQAGVTTGTMGAMGAGPMGGALTFTAGATAGMLAGAAEFGFQLEAGLALDEFLEFKDEMGRKIDPQAAQAAALATGALNAGLEAVGLGTLLKSIPGANRLVGGIGRSAVKQALRVPTVRAALVEAAKTYGTTLATETGVEVAQRAITVMSGELAKVASGLETQGAGEIAADLANEGAAALQSFALLSLPGPAMSVAGARAQAQRAQQNEQFFTAMAEGMAAVKSLERMPAVVQEYLQKVTQDGPIETLYVPAESWGTYWQKAGQDPRQLAEELTGNPDAFDTAIRTGEDLAIPTAAYAVKVAGTEHNAFFAQEMRLAPGEMNAREAKMFHEEQKALAAKTGQESETVPTSGDKIRQAVTQQLEGAGVDAQTAAQYAELYGSAFVSMAERAGQDPAQLFGQYGLKVARPDMPGGELQGAPAAAAENLEAGGQVAPATSAAPAANVQQLEELATDEAMGVQFAEDGTSTFEDGSSAIVCTNCAEKIIAKVGRGEVWGWEEGTNPSSVVAGPERGARVEGGQGHDFAIIDGRYLVDPWAKNVEGSSSRAAFDLADPTDRAEVARLYGDPATWKRRTEAGFVEDRPAALVDRPVVPIVDKKTEGEQTEETLSDEAEPIPSRVIDSARMPAGGRIASIQPGGGRKGEARATKHLEQIFATVLEHARILDPNINELELRRELDFRIDVWLDQRNLAAEAGQNPLVILKAIRKLGGISLEGERSQEIGELRDKIKAFGAIAGVGGVFTTPQRNRSGNQRSKGWPIDQMLQMLQSDPRFAYLESIDQLVDVIDEAARHGVDHIDTSILPGTEDLRDVGIRLERQWWPDSWRTADMREDVDESALAAGEGDAALSFDVKEFDQGLFDEQLKEEFTKGTAVDKLDTGEGQARLPGEAGDVRDQERKQEEFELPFSLTAPVAKPSKKSGQRTLFQDAPITQEQLDQLEGKLKEKHPGLETLQLRLDPARGDIWIDLFVVDRGVRSEGIGSRVMQDVTRLADQAGRRLVLQLAGPQDKIGTTSKKRLGEFYRRFGFVPNRGRNKDFRLSIYASMYREPTINPGRERELFQPAWHGSPHAFERFSLQQIGTGEGAQSFGWGLYFASRKSIAEFYRDALSSRSATAEQRLAVSMMREAGTREAAIEKAEQAQRNVMKAIRFAREATALIEVADDKDFDRAAYDRAVATATDAQMEAIGHTDMTTEAMSQFARELDGAIKHLKAKSEKAGRLYKVEIPDNDVLLDYDRPASQQPPAVQEALRKLGVTWEEFKPKSLAQFKRWMESKQFEDLWREDIGIRNSLRTAKFHADNGNLEQLKRWQEQHQGYFAKGMIDPTGESIYADLGNKLADDVTAFDPREGRPGLRERAMMASTKLAELGVKGLRYLDASSRDKAEGQSHNFVIFDDELVNVTEFFQKTKPELLIQHNLTAANLEHALKRGGIAVPSLAITRADDALVNFGEITLIGPREMAAPSSDTQVFAADVYSPRYPTIHFKISSQGEKKLSEALKPYSSIPGLPNYYDLDSLRKDGANYLRREEPRVRAAFLDSKGLLDRDALKEAHDAIEDDRNSRRRFTVQRMLEDAIREQGLEQEFEQFADELFESLGATEQIFRGFTNQGNKSYTPHTLENVVKILKKDLRGGESDANIYGVGQLRSKFTPKFKTLAGIQKARDRIVSDAEFEEVKKEVETELFAITDSLKSSYIHGDSERFGFVDTVMAVMADAPKAGLSRALAEYGFEDVPAEVQTAIGDFLRKLRELPTEYFEAKITRAVQPSEFKAAVVPSDIKPELRAALEEAGLTVVEYQKGDPATRKQAINEAALSFGDEVLFQDPSDKRGSIRFGPDRQFTINLFERADLSTFLHESGHFFLEVFGDLADQIAAQERNKGIAGAAPLSLQQAQALTDYQALLKWLGAENREQLTDEHHEKFARGFEAYLMEGKAPSQELRQAFARFRAWLIGIYKSLAGLRVELTPEVRQVFDRMIATDDAIAAAQHDTGMRPMFTDATAAGMSEAEFALYSRDVAEASRIARENLERQLLDDVQREQRRAWKAKRAEIREVVETEANGMPVYQALAAMRTGKKPDGTDLAEFPTDPLKLSKKMLVARFGAERVARLPRPFIYSADGGMDPELVANLFGFTSGDEMLTAIEKAPPRENFIERETNRRMMQEQGGILLDGTLHEKAEAALAGEHREKVIRAELRALWKLQRQAAPFIALGEEAAKAERRERDYERRWFEAEAKLRIAIAEGRKQVEIDELDTEVKQLKEQARRGAATINAAMPPASVLREAARERIAKTSIRSLNPAVFLQAARRSSQAAMEAAARQDFEDAILAKQQELINSALYHEATKAKADVEKRIKAAQDLATTAARKRIGLAGQSYLDQIDGILDRYDFARVTQKALDRREAIRTWIEVLTAEGIPVDLPDEIVDESRRIHFRELTVEALIGVTDGLAHIAHLARLKNRLLKSAKDRDLQALATDLATSIRANFKGKPRSSSIETRLPADQFHRTLEAFFAGHRKMASLARELDGFEDGGAVWDAIIRPMNEAADREAELNIKATKTLTALVREAYPGREKIRLYDMVRIDAIGQSLSKMGRIMVALNWGNDGNRQRIMSGYGWSETQVEAVLETLDARDWVFIQGVWDFIDGYWQEIADKQARVTGLAPEKVEAMPVRTKFGEMRGGYFPIKYDDRQSAQAAGFVDLETANLQQQAAYVRATTRRGHTEARKKKVTLPVRTDFGVIFEHVSQVIHDLSHHEMLIDVGRVLGHRDVQKAIYETHGDIVYRQFKEGLKDVAFGTVPAVGGFEKAMNHVRVGATIAGLGWNVTTSALQPLGLFQSIVRIGAGPVARGITRWLRSPKSFVETPGWINEKSTFMRTRSMTQQREINEIRNSVGINTGKFASWIDEALNAVSLSKFGRQDAIDSFFFLIVQMQRVADVPTWLGMYEKQMAAGETEARAIAMADQAVLDSQGGGQIKDLAGVQRGGPLLRLWTTFYSFFNTTYNIAVESKRSKSPGRMASDYLMLFIVPATLGYFLRAALRPGDEIDEEELGKELARENLSYIMGMMLGLRELGGAVEGYAGYEGPAGARAFASAAKLVKQVEQGEADAAFWKALNETAGTLLHYPAGQTKRTMEGLTAIIEGKTANPLALITGAPREQ